MKKKKKITRKQKIELSRKKICWKCGHKIIKNENKIECINPECNLQIDII